MLNGIHLKEEFVRSKLPLTLTLLFTIIFCLPSCNLTDLTQAEVKQTAEKKENTLRVKLVSCSTGNTCLVDIVGESSLFSKNVAILIDGYISPNPNSTCDEEIIRAQKAKSFVEEKIKNSKEVFLTKARKNKESSYLLGKLMVDGKDIANWVITKGLGAPVGLEVDWCEESRRKMEI